MHGSKRIARARYSAGVVHRVDTINRELTVFVNGELLTFDIPVGCPVILHGEPVKLRMVQPQDRVRILHAGRGALRIARVIEVQPEQMAGQAIRAQSGRGQPAES